MSFKLIVLILLSLCITLLAYLFLNVENKIYFMLIFFIFLFSTLQFLVNEKEIKIKVNLFGVKLALVLVHAFCILVLAFSPVNNNLFLPWGFIKFSNFVGFVAAFLLIMFFPGYVILSLIEWDSGFVDSLVLSYLLSIFLSGLFKLVDLWIIGLGGRSAVIVPNLVLFLLHVVTLLRKRRELLHYKREIYKMMNFYEALAFSCLIGLIMLGHFTIVSNSYPMLPGANSNIFSYSISFTKGIPTLNSLHGVPSRALAFNYPYWLLMCLALLYDTSVFPSLNAYVSLFALTFMPFLSLYLMMNSFLKRINPKIPLLSVIFSAMPGCGWLYALYLSFTSGTSNYELLWEAGDKTYDIWRGILILPNTITPVFLVGLPTFFTLLYILKERPASLSRDFLVCVIFALNMLGHFAESIIFVIVYALFVLLGRRLVDVSIKTTLMLLFSLLFILLFDLTSPIQLCTYFSDFRLSFYIMLITIIAVLPIQFLIQKEVNRFFGIIERFRIPTVTFNYMIIILVYLYLLSFVIWYQILPIFSSINCTNPFFPPGNMDPYFVPWYLYPIRLGISAPFALLGLAYITKNWDNLVEDEKNLLKFFILAIILMYITSRISGALFLYPPDRFDTFILVMLSVLSSYGVLGFCRVRSRSLKKIAKRLLVISLALLIGFGSLAYRYSFYTKMGILSSDYSFDKKREALEYVCNETPPHRSCLALSSETQQELRTYCGVWSTIGYFTYWRRLFPLLTMNPQDTFYILNGLRVKCVYISSSDVHVLKNFKHSFLSSYLLNYLPIVVNSSSTIIYEVPDFSSPNIHSSLTILEPSIIDENFYHTISAIALAKVQYSILKNDDYSILDYLNYSEVVILDDEGIQNEVEHLINWVSEGGRLIIIGSKIGGFAKFMSVNEANISVRSNNIIVNNEVIWLPKEINITLTYSNNKQVEVAAFYRYDNSSAAPFSYLMKLGKGEILYLYVKPYFFTLNNENYRSVWPDFFIKMGDILRSTLKQKNADFKPSTLRNYMYGTIKLVGNMSLMTNHTLLQKDVSLTIKKLVIESNNTQIEKDNVTLSITLYGYIPSNIKMPFNDTFAPLPEGYYLGIIPQTSFDWELYPSGASSVKLLIKEDNNSELYIIDNGIIKFLGSKINLPSLLNNCEYILDLFYGLSARSDWLYNPAKSYNFSPGDIVTFNVYEPDKGMKWTYPLKQDIPITRYMIVKYKAKNIDKEDPVEKYAIYLFTKSGKNFVPLNLKNLIDDNKWHIIVISLMSKTAVKDNITGIAFQVQAGKEGNATISYDYICFTNNIPVIYLESPIVELNGSITIEKADFPPFSGGIEPPKVNINGSLIFQPSYSVDDLIILNKYAIKGDFNERFSSAENRLEKMWREWQDVPWWTILISPLHFIVVAITIILAIIFLRRQDPS